ncbi:unnamed protein product [Effrenium voratum]|nr:unnamed protein product [Effrenium voratum]
MWNADHRCSTSVALRSAWESFKDLAAYELQLRPMGFKRCPACQVACDKADPLSCDHITCECGHEFCWVCGEDRRIILAHDNSYHHKRCRFFEPCNEKPKLEKKCARCQSTGVPCLRPPQEQAVKQAALKKRVMGLEVKHWSEAERSEAALITEKSEPVRQLNPFSADAFSQMFCGGPLASCCRALGGEHPR